MKRFLFLSLMLVLGIVSAMSANDEGWTIYASYHNPTKAVRMNGRIYVLANGDIFSYDPEDKSIELYDKAGGLRDFGIYDIAYCAATKSLVLLYANGNIDIINSQHKLLNLTDLKTSFANPELHELSISGNEAFISADNMLVVLNLKDFYFVNTYKFEGIVRQSVANAKAIYVKTSKGTYFGDRSKNLLNPANWELKSDASLANDELYQSLENENKSDAALLESVKNLNVNSPIRNYCYKLNMIGKRLLVAGGNFYYPEVDYPGTAMKFEDGRWTAFDETLPVAEVGANTYLNVTDVVQDPNDSEHHWLGTKRSGIYEFKNYKMVNHYSLHNAPLTSILPDNPNAQNFVRTTALNIDKSGNLWMCNNETDTIIKIMKPNKTWVKYYYSELEGKPTWDNTYFDSRGWAWMNCRRSTNAFGASGIFVLDTNGTIDNTRDDRHHYISSFTNQDGKLYAPDLWYCVVEDLNGAMWVGNTEGVFMAENVDEVFKNGFSFTQIKVPRNDGTDLADYLLTGVPIKCIAIDGANRKWIGTVNNGVYLISADGLEIHEHFTKDNSPLIDDQINDIAINGETGEVFIATPSGLCSYRGDATDAETTLESNNLKVFPNPVRPEYNGDVHVTGLAYNTDVKVVNAGGKLVYSGTSSGGQFNWNCCYKTGQRVASGVYYVLCTDEVGRKGACAKIVIVN